MGWIFFSCPLSIKSIFPSLICKVRSKEQNLFLFLSLDVCQGVSMDVFLQKVTRAWEDRRLLFAEHSPSSYQPLTASEELTALTPSSNHPEPRPGPTTPSGALKEGHASLRSSLAWLSKQRPRSTWLTKPICATIVVLTPSWFMRGEGDAKELHATAWLDGLRGVASLLVVFHHCSVLWYMPLNRGWHSSPADVSLVQLPIIRLFYSGPPMVAIFFIISGFSLSYKALSLTRHGRHEMLLDSLSSSVLRRGLRLVLPPAVVTFFSMLATYLQLYGTGPDGREPPQSPHLWEHLKSWWRSVFELADPFRPLLFPGAYLPTYDRNLWTIPVELHGSMVIFVTLLGLARVRGRYRMGLLCGLVLYAICYFHLHIFLFLSGVVLAELHHARVSPPGRVADGGGRGEISDLSSPAPPAASRRRCTATQLFWLLHLLAALWMLSMPSIEDGAGESPGYMLLASCIPASYQGKAGLQDTFWVNIGAVYLVLVLECAPFLRAVFTTRIAQYLGRISFALYICHGTLLYTLGWHVSARALARTGAGGEWGKAAGVGATVSVVFPLLFWMSDVVARHVDARSVRWARWLQGRISVGT